MGIAGAASGYRPICNDYNSTLDAFVSGNGATVDIGPGSAYAINASGQVTGATYTLGAKGPTTPAGAFLYSKGTMTILPGGAVTGSGINAGGFIVGGGINGVNGPVSHAFFYDGVTIDLNTFILPSDPLQPYVTLHGAIGINDTGMVVAGGVDSRTQAAHTYLLQVPLIRVSPGPLTFPSLALGTTSAPQAVTFTNTGTTVIALGALSITGNFAVQSNNCSVSLAPTAGCSAAVTFTPTVVGTPAGGLTLVAGGVPILVPLSGSSPFSVSLKASVTTVTTGTPITLTWTSGTGASCSASGGSATDGWMGNFPASGTKAVSESAAGTYTYVLNCSAGSETQTAQVSVVVTWPVVTASISASPMTVSSGGSTTLTWTSTNATSCVGSGGGTNDGWASNGRPINGSVPVTEPVALVAGASEALTFSITCTSSVSNLSATASAKVVQNGPSSSGSSGGGGAFDLLSLIFLLPILALSPLRQLR